MINVAVPARRIGVADCAASTGRLATAPCSQVLLSMSEKCLVSGKGRRDSTKKQKKTAIYNNRNERNTHYIIYILYSSAMAIDRAMQCCGKQLTYIARSSTTNEAGF